jgi:hypothetical protein
LNRSKLLTSLAPDRSTLHPQYTSTSGLKSATQSNETAVYPPPTYPASRSLSMSRTPQPVKQGSQSPYLCTNGPPPRRPDLASHHPYGSQDGFSSEISKMKGQCTHPDGGKLFQDLKAHMLMHRNEDSVKNPKQTHSKDDFLANDNAVEPDLTGLWNTHGGPSVANLATESPVVSRPLSKNSDFAPFAEEPRISPKLTRFPEIRTPEVLEKRLADFVFKLHSYQQNWEGSGERQCPGPRDHPWLRDQDSMSQTPAASCPASRSPPDSRGIILQHIQLRDDPQQRGRLLLPPVSPESSPEPSEFEPHINGKKVVTSQSKDPCEGKPVVSFILYYIFEL